MNLILNLSQCFDARLVGNRLCVHVVYGQLLQLVMFSFVFLVKDNWALKDLLRLVGILYLGTRPVHLLGVDRGLIL